MTAIKEKKYREYKKPSKYIRFKQRVGLLITIK